jgi:glucose 1-dehydrogenase
MALAKDQIRRAQPIKITVTDRAPNKGTDAVIADLRNLGVAVSALYADLRDLASIETLVKGAASGMGGIDCVVANAGVVSPGTCIQSSESQFDLLFDVNVKAVWRLAKASHSYLADSRGTFTAVGSMSGLEPHPTLGLYGVSKAAVIHLCRTLALEWARDGIRVNAVCPGMTRTPLTERIYLNEYVARERDAIVPLGRVALPEDIASVVAFLSSEQSAYVTGQSILVDGGLSNSMLGRLPVLPSGHISS